MNQSGRKRERCFDPDDFLGLGKLRPKEDLEPHRDERRAFEAQDETQ
jgi:hypothetical protein